MLFLFLSTAYNWIFQRAPVKHSYPQQQEITKLDYENIIFESCFTAFVWKFTANLKIYLRIGNRDICSITGPVQMTSLMCVYGLKCTQ